MSYNYRRALLVLALGFCLSFPSCSSDSDDDRASAYSPESVVMAKMSAEDAQGLTGDSPMPEVLQTYSTATYTLEENGTGVSLKGTCEPDPEGGVDAFAIDIGFNYDDRGLYSSYTLSRDEELEDFQAGYRFTDGVVTRKTILKQGDAGSYLAHIITGSQEGGGITLIKDYEYNSGDGYQDVDRDESGDFIDLLCREHRDGEGRLIRQVFYDTVDPEEANDSTTGSIILYEYDDAGNIAAEKLYEFSGELAGTFDGDFDGLSPEAASFNFEVRWLYNAQGNLRYVVALESRDDSMFCAITWGEPQGLSARAANFLRDDVRWNDMHPLFGGYGNFGLLPLVGLFGWGGGD